MTFFFWVLQNVFESIFADVMNKVYLTIWFISLSNSIIRKQMQNFIDLHPVEEEIGKTIKKFFYGDYWELY